MADETVEKIHRAMEAAVHLLDLSNIPRDAICDGFISWSIVWARTILGPAALAVHLRKIADQLDGQAEGTVTH
ncbi:hypothetical protein V5F77_20405 [Xanthobacter sp. DSM 24535]|uniref:hypothetical protein n=1 Tax=Roseixanthobacter psychrophilus TaxID=3119917 RepID=UPI00372B3906